MSGRTVAALMFLAPAAASLAACNDPTYLTEIRQLSTGNPTDGGAPTTDDEQSYGLPIRAPTGAERQALAMEQKKLGLDKPVPWVGVRDLPVELLFTVTNLGDTPTQAFVRIDGADEFGAYSPDMYIDPKQLEQTLPPPLLGNMPIDLAPHETRQVVYREDDVAEAALDVEAIVRYPSMPVAATPFKVLAHRAEDSNVGFENVPANDVTPQIINYIIHLHSEGTVTVDYTLRTRDLHGRLASSGMREYP